MTKNSKPKLMPIVKQDKVEIYRNGVISRRGCSRLVNITAFEDGNRKERSKGDIRAFSQKSRRRLREFLVRNEVPDAFPIGLTLTMPSRYSYNVNHSKQAAKADDEFDEGKLEEAAGCESKNPIEQKEDLVSGFPETVNRFGKYLQRAFPRSGCVWRVELQKRGAPHLHCVLWLHGSEADYFDRLDPCQYPRYRPDVLLRFSVMPLHARICDCWCRAVQQTCQMPEEDLLKFWWGFGQDVQPLLNRSRYMRYCCDHLSKHKQEQLGYPGRQWAVIGRKWFTAIPPVVVEDFRTRARLRRVLGMIRRTKERKDGCIFGYRRRKYHPADSGTTICGEDTLRRLRDWLAIDVRDTVESAEDVGSALPIDLRISGGRFADDIAAFLRDDLSMRFAPGCRSMADAQWTPDRRRQRLHSLD